MREGGGGGGGDCALCTGTPTSAERSKGCVCDIISFNFLHDHFEKWGGGGGGEEDCALCIGPLTTYNMKTSSSTTSVLWPSPPPHTFPSPSPYLPHVSLFTAHIYGNVHVICQTKLMVMGCLKRPCMQNGSAYMYVYIIQCAGVGQSVSTHILELNTL